MSIEHGAFTAEAQSSQRKRRDWWPLNSLRPLCELCACGGEFQLPLSSRTNKVGPFDATDAGFVSAKRGGAGANLGGGRGVLRRGA